MVIDVFILLVLILMFMFNMWVAVVLHNMVQGLYEKPSDIKTLAWVIAKLYDGASWSSMEKERPWINEVCDRLGVFND